LFVFAEIDTPMSDPIVAPLLALGKDAPLLRYKLRIGFLIKIS